MKIYRLIVVILILFFTSAVSVSAQVSEEVLKAVFLERLTRFVNWPPTSDVNDTAEPFIITVLGENTFGPVLEQLYETYKIRNKIAQVRVIKDLDDLGSTDLLFVSSSEKNQFDEIIRDVSGKGVLLVGDTAGFAQAGGHVNLFFVQNKLRFEINEKAIKNEDFKVSYLLLRLAKIVSS